MAPKYNAKIGMSKEEVLEHENLRLVEELFSLKRAAEHMELGQQKFKIPKTEKCSRKRVCNLIQQVQGRHIVVHTRFIV
jgi:hypothetical protein